MFTALPAYPSEAATRRCGQLRAGFCAAVSSHPKNRRGQTLLKRGAWLYCCRQACANDSLVAKGKNKRKFVWRLVQNQHHKSIRISISSSKCEACMRQGQQQRAHLRRNEDRSKERAVTIGEDVLKRIKHAVGGPRFKQKITSIAAAGISNGAAQLLTLISSL